MLANLQNRIAIEVSTKISRKYRIDIDFELRDNLIYYTSSNIDKHTRLCILIIQKKDIFQAIHNKYYTNVHRCFHRITKTLYILQLLRKLQAYVEHCFACQVNQIKRHRSYNKLILISLSSYFFYTIVINFVIELLNKYNVLLTIIDKFSRRLLLLSSYVTNFVAT